MGVRRVRCRRLSCMLATALLAGCGDITWPSEASVLLAVGDIAGCESTGDEAVSALLDTLPGTIATLGDNVYFSGTLSQFTNCFEPSWGRHKERIRPSIGNHDWTDDGTFDGYFDYFGAAAGPRHLGYYSYSVGNWHVIAINSEIDVSERSAQIAWLKQDLARYRAYCTVAYWHRPRFTSGDHMSDERMQDLWQVLYDADADVVLNGHEHNYERFAPQSPSGRLDTSRGIRQFVVGTGGFLVEESLSGNRIANSEFRDGAHFGVLRLLLEQRGYRWEFVTTGGIVLDSGEASCH